MSLEPTRVQVEERYRALFDSMEEGFCTIEVLFDGDGRAVDYRFLEVNPAFESQTGLSDAQGKRMRELAPQHESYWYEVYGKIALTGEPLRFEHRADALNRWYEVYAYRVGDPDAHHVAVMFKDITERKREQARNQLLVSMDDAIRPLVDPAAITAVAARLLGQHLAVSRCAYADVEDDQDTFNLTGNYNDGVPSIVGRYRFTQFGHECLRLMRAGEPYVVADTLSDPRTVAVRDAYATTQIRAVICVPLLKAGRFVAAMAVHQAAPRVWRSDEVDLLARVAARCWESIERARVAWRLQDSEAQLRLIADSLPVLIAYVDADERYQFNNRAYESWFGMPAAELKGRTVREVLGERAYEKARPHVRRALAGEALSFEDLLESPGGPSRHVQATYVPDRGVAGDVRGYYAMVLDVSERKRADEEREALLRSERSARAEVERAGRLKDEFLATLSHELRTPLNAILGWAHLLRRDLGDSARIGQGLAVIERNARVQTQLISDLLDMSRIIAGKMRLEVENVELGSVVESALESVRPSAEARGVRIHTVIEPIGAVLRGDSARLQQVVWNLLSNAVKFTSRGGRVQVVLARRHSGVELAVSDDGAGIEPEFLPYVFERFRQADASTTRKHGGLGLGLSIVKQLVELHGGKALAFSEGPGQGATFLVQLPLSALPASSEAALRGPHPRAATPPDDLPVQTLGGVRVLVLDDDADARDLLRRLLEEREAEVRTAGSAEEAREALRGFAPSVILSDIGMPDEDGYQLISAVRASGNQTPAIALTAFARSEDRTRALISGYQSHVAKPVEPAELVAAIAALALRAEARSGGS